MRSLILLTIATGSLLPLFLFEEANAAYGFGGQPKPLVSKFVYDYDSYEDDQENTPEANSTNSAGTPGKGGLSGRSATSTDIFPDGTGGGDGEYFLAPRPSGDPRIWGRGLSGRSAASSDTDLGVDEPVEQVSNNDDVQETGVNDLSDPQVNVGVSDPGTHISRKGAFPADAYVEGIGLPAGRDDLRKSFGSGAPTYESPKYRFVHWLTRPGQGYFPEKLSHAIHKDSGRNFWRKKAAKVDFPKGEDNGPNE